MKAYKGFSKEMKCNGFQFEAGKTYEEPVAILCEKGFHACENPRDIFNYYSAGCSKFHEVEMDDISTEKQYDSKRVSKKIKINAEISAFDICKIAVKIFFDNIDFNNKTKSADTINAGDYGAANAGPYGAANAGDYGTANAGPYGAANAGYQGAANAGDQGAANAGDQGAANAGDHGAANAGYQGAASVKNDGVAIVIHGKVKGGLRSILIIKEIDENNEIINFKVAQVDGIKIKADTWYKLKNGEFMEIENA
jgi:hypothetical protein